MPFYSKAAADLRALAYRAERLPSDPYKNSPEVIFMAKQELSAEMQKLATRIEDGRPVEAPAPKPKRNMRQTFERGTVTGRDGSVVRVEFRGR